MNDAGKHKKLVMYCYKLIGSETKATNETHIKAFSNIIMKYRMNVCLIDLFVFVQG